MPRSREHNPRRLKYKWWPWRAHRRWDLILMGDPDAFAYVVRHESPIKNVYGGAWCWILTMPRGGREVARSWASSPHEAKLQVEAAIRELSC